MYLYLNICRQLGWGKKSDMTQNVGVDLYSGFVGTYSYWSIIFVSSICNYCLLVLPTPAQLSMISIELFLILCNSPCI